ncbi:molybdenum cofactor sulfurase [uncultured Roseibium sp.]|uniref:MOSC domain-containing protein n=1 Tax=uncultured Roseibium sp. TaxID=1936171 RepID=UPI0026183A9B|nr:molybdenum cofactor sulfurase [uncultured Roseibium sp.]
MSDQLSLLPDTFETTPKFKVSGRIEGIFGTSDKDDFRTDPVDFLELTFEGIPGDRHAGFTRLSGGREPWYPRGTQMCNERQVSILSSEELIKIAALMQIEELKPEWIGANFLLSGIPDLTRVPARTRLVFESGLVVRVDGDNLPCRFAGATIAQNYPDREGLDLLFAQKARGLRGLVGYVEKPGVARSGEGVVAHIPEQWIYRRS